MADSNEFKWGELEDEALVAPSMQAVAAYTNPKGDVVIRQERDWNEEEDSFVVVPKMYLPKLIERLQKLAD